MYTKVEVSIEGGEMDKRLSNYFTKIHAILTLFPLTYPSISTVLFNTLREEFKVNTCLVGEKLEIVFSDLLFSPFYLLFFIICVILELSFLIGGVR